MAETLALFGGTPVRDCVLPYGRQTIDEDDVTAVVGVLRSDWLTTGPKVSEFERAFASYVGAQNALAVSSGTAALHAAIAAIGIEPGDEVIVPAMTFAASANCVVYVGGTPVFADVDGEALLIDADDVAAKITPRTKAVIAVDYAGQPCDYDALRAVAAPYGLPIVSDACHALGATYKGKHVGTLGDLNAFSFHPVKHITTAEGGMVTTSNGNSAAKVQRFRNHGIFGTFRDREARDSWAYEMIDLGYNYRLSDLQCALGISQLRKLPEWLAARRAIAERYTKAIADIPALDPLVVRRGVSHAYHLYVVRLRVGRLRAKRDEIFRALRAEGIGVNVHYPPVHLHPFYRRRFDTGEGLCPVAENVYEGILSLPIFPSMSDRDVDNVIAALRKVISYYDQSA